MTGVTGVMGVLGGSNKEAAEKTFAAPQLFYLLPRFGMNSYVHSVPP